MMADILIVDDEPDLREAYGYSLMRAGYGVRYAGSARECLDALNKAAADLVILDVVLPDANGMELCRTLKSNPEHGNTFVIHVSGQRIGAEDIALGLDTGADGYLTKPLNHLTLLAHVKALLRIRNAEQALRASEEAHRLLVLDLKEANQRLHEYNRLKAEFVANISHELRTPLTAIIGFAQLATLRSDAATLPAAVHDAFERILRNGRHLLALIDDVLDLSKLEAGRMPLHCEHFDIAEVLQDAFGELQALAQQKGLRYRLKVNDTLPIAYSDPRRIRQIAMNLLSNAIKFTASGSVQLDVAALDDERFEFRVADTGIGIDPEAQALVFDRFRQVDGSTTRAQGGVGLGLAIVRELVRLLGGEISLSSELGKGSSFHVVLPYSAPENKNSAAAGIEDRRPDPVTPTMKPLRVRTPRWHW